MRLTENYIPELTKLAQENEDFSGETTDLNGGHTVEGTTWTMAGMFAQTSGLPLKTSIDANDRIRMNISPGYYDFGRYIKRTGVFSNTAYRIKS